MAKKVKRAVKRGPEYYAADGNPRSWHNVTLYIYDIEVFDRLTKYCGRVGRTRSNVVTRLLHWGVPLLESGELQLDVAGFEQLALPFGPDIVAKNRREHGKD